MTKNEANQAKQVILELIRAAGGSWAGKTKLYKAFYLAHLYYADREPGFLTSWPIVRMPNGPGVDQGDELLEELVFARDLDLESIKIGPYPSTTYHLAEGAGRATELSEAAIRAIQDAVQFVSPKSAQELSDLTHDFSRSWNTAKDGEELNIYIDLIPASGFDDQGRRLDALGNELRAAWKVSR